MVLNSLPDRHSVKHSNSVLNRLQINTFCNSIILKKFQIFKKNLINTKSKCQLLSRIWLFATPWTVARQAPLSMGFSRQEYWSGLPFPPPGDFPDPGIKSRSPALQRDSLPSEHRSVVEMKIFNVLISDQNIRKRILRKDQGNETNLLLFNF